MFHFVNVILHNIYIVNDSRESRPGTCSMVLKVFNCARRYKIQRDSFHQDPFSYSETTPYGHLGNTVTSVLQPLSFGGLAKTAIHFLVKKNPSFLRPFFWPIGDRIKGVPLYFNIVPSLARSLRSSSLSGDFFSRSCALFQASSAHIHDSANWPGNKTAQISNTS